MPKFRKLIVLTGFIFLGFCEQLLAQWPDTLRYSHVFVNTAYADVFRQFESDLSLHFYYSPEWIPAEKAVRVTFKNHLFTDVLESVISSIDLTFVAIGNDVFLLPKTEVARVTGQLGNFDLSGTEKPDVLTIGDEKLMGKFKKITINGMVTDGANDEPLTGATIKVEGTNNYAVSGYTGAFVLTVDAGVYDITANILGYESKSFKIKAVSPGNLPINLFEKSHEINEVVVTSFRTENNVRNNLMSLVEMDARSIKQLPLLVGEKDIIKGFTMMPGVKTVGEFGAGINVRGGGEDQNLYLLEDAPVFNTSHALGLMSVINPDAVNSVSLYKGHIPAEYGERVSSVMDIRLHDFNSKEFKIMGGIGIFSSRLQLQGPLFYEKVTFKIGGRTSYSDYLLKQMPDYYLSNSSIRFYDLNGLINIQLKNNPISVFGYYSNDFFRYARNFSYQYGNKLASLAWSHFFNADLSSGLTLAYSHYAIDNKEFSEPLYARKVSSEIQYLKGKFKLTYTGLPDHQLQTGIQAVRYDLQPGTQAPLITGEHEQPATRYFKTKREQANELTVFLNDVYDVNKKLSFQGGLRFTAYSYLGPRTVNHYRPGVAKTCENVTDSTVYANGKTIYSYKALEPRLSVKYVISDNNSIKASYNRNRQNMTLLSHTSITTPDDVWKLADTYIKPLMADQLAIGYYHNFMGNMFETSVELYYKDLKNMVEFKNGADSTLNNHIETELIAATGKNYGVEFFVKKTMGNLTGTFTYTYSRAMRQTHSDIKEEQINKNREFASSYDKPHDINLMLSYSVNRRLRFGANFGFTTGRPFTRPEYTYRVSGQEIVYFSDRNKYRIPPYHRLDLSVSFDENLKKSRKWKGSWTFSVLNVYARKNPYSIAYRREIPSEQNNYQVFSLYKIYLIGKPFPTLTYNFTF